MYPGHGNVISDPTQHISNYISHIMKKEKQICLFLENCEFVVTNLEIATGVYKGKPTNTVKNS